MSRTAATALPNIHNDKTGMTSPVRVHDKSKEHAGSLPWKQVDENTLRVQEFNDPGNPSRCNHACLDLVYKLEEPGSIGYQWKVEGKSASGGEVFDRYWFLRGSDGTLRYGSDFLAEAQEYQEHRFDDLDAGEYTLTMGVFCFGVDGAVSVNLARESKEG